MPFQVLSPSEMAAKRREWFDARFTKARAGGVNSADAREFFLSGGCHAWAMAAATQWNGVMRYSKTALFSDDSGRQSLADCFHAWCEAGGQVADFLGFASNTDELLTRYTLEQRNHPGLVPTHAEVRENYSLNLEDVQAVLAGTATLPQQFFGEVDLVRQAVEFARTALPAHP